MRVGKCWMLVFEGGGGGSQAGRGWVPLEGARAWESPPPSQAQQVPHGHKTLDSLFSLQATPLFVLLLSLAYCGWKEGLFSGLSGPESSLNTSQKRIKVSPWVMVHVTKAQWSGAGPQMMFWCGISDYLFVWIGTRLLLYTNLGCPTALLDLSSPMCNFSGMLSLMCPRSCPLASSELQEVTVPPQRWSLHLCQQSLPWHASAQSSPIASPLALPAQGTQKSGSLPVDLLPGQLQAGTATPHPWNP